MREKLTAALTSDGPAAATTTAGVASADPENPSENSQLGDTIDVASLNRDHEPSDGDTTSPPTERFNRAHSAADGQQESSGRQ